MTQKSQAHSAHPKQSSAPAARPNTSFAGTLRRCIRNNLFIIGVAVIFMALATALIYAWYATQLNPDASSYFTIADKYAHGDFRHALNGYWGPLLSWLLVPAVWLGIGLSGAAKMVAALAATGILVVTYRFLTSRGVRFSVAATITVVTSIILLQWSIIGPITPDMVMAFLTLLFAVKLSDFLARPSRLQAALLGVIGAAMFFTKGFGFFLFIGVIGVVALWQLWRERDLKDIVLRYVPAAAVLLLLTLPFMAANTLKYHKLTINNAGMYNMNVVGPLGHNLQTIDTAGPLAPPNDTAISGWEDPTNVTYDSMAWSPLESPSYLKYYLSDVLYANVTHTITYIWGMGPIVPAGLLMLLVGVFYQRNRREYGVFGLIAAATLGGYALVFVTDRYLWGAAVLAIVGVGLWLEHLTKEGVLRKVQLVAAGLVVMATLLVPSVLAYHDNRNPNAEWKGVAQDLDAVFPEHAKLMSDDFPRSYPVCYYLHIQCYNVMNPPQDAALQPAYLAAVKSNGVTYFMDFHTRPTDENLQAFIAKHFTQIDERMAGGYLVTTYHIR